MPLEEITGIQFPAQEQPDKTDAWVRVLEHVGDFSAARLHAAGFFTADTAGEVLGSYKAGLSTSLEYGASPSDFMAFAAEMQAARKGSPIELEVALMQNILLSHFPDRVQSWTFGALPGPVEGLYGQCVSTRSGCEALSCPSILGGEVSIVHVTSLNPTAALVAASWIRQELARQGGGESPFVFSMVLDLVSWRGAMKRHFGAS